MFDRIICLDIKILIAFFLFAFSLGYFGDIFLGKDKDE